jgi:hypothetical protein
MTIRMKTTSFEGARGPVGLLGALGAGALAVLLGVTPAGAVPLGSWTATITTTYCSTTAAEMYRACGGEGVDDYWTQTAKCTNLSDNNERTACQKDAEAERTAHQELCTGQRDARLAACRLLGERRYDPDLEPAMFESDYTRLSHPNPYFPLKIGNQWEYTSGDEFNVVKILDHTKLIDEIRCIVALDQVFTLGDLTEDTNDWFCQAVDGTVWYFGEETSELESFDGDVPRLPEVVSTDGSFKADRDLDAGGIIFLASPKKGDAYYEEFSLGNAEDLSLILSTTYKYGNNRELDKDVPRALADLFCSAGDCVVTRNTSQLEPGIVERKYYARGIGVFVETNLSGERPTVLTGCNFDPRCALLPGH